MNVTILVASYLEPALAQRISETLPGLRLLYDPALVPPPRYQADHTGPATWSRTPEQEARFREWLAEADVLFDFDRRLAPQLAELAPKLRWIQSTSSGIGPFVKKAGLDKTGILITNAAGIHAIPLAEHALLSMLHFCKNVPFLKREQTAHRWERYCGRELRGQTAVVVGLGAVGTEVARLARAAGLRVLGVKRSTEGLTPADLHVDELFSDKELHAVLPRAQYLILIVPQTPQTDNMIGARELALMPPGSVLINIARGTVVDQEAMLSALRSGHLAGAALDVASPEPLDPASPLWEMENVLITPHSASTVEKENERLVDLFCENLRRFAAGKPLINEFRV